MYDLLILYSGADHWFSYLLISHFLELMFSFVQKLPLTVAQAPCPIHAPGRKDTQVSNLQIELQNPYSSSLFLVCVCVCFVVAVHLIILIEACYLNSCSINTICRLPLIPPIDLFNPCRCYFLCSTHFDNSWHCYYLKTDGQPNQLTFSALHFTFFFLTSSLQIFRRNYYKIPGGLVPLCDE